MTVEILDQDAPNVYQAPEEDKVSVSSGGPSETSDINADVQENDENKAVRD